MIQVYADDITVYNSRLNGHALLGLKATAGVNKGGTAADFLALIAHVQQVVMEQKGIMLEPEVRILGEDAPVTPV